MCVLCVWDKAHRKSQRFCTCESKRSEVSRTRDTPTRNYFSGAFVWTLTWYSFFLFCFSVNKKSSSLREQPSQIETGDWFHSDDSIVICCFENFAPNNWRRIKKIDVFHFFAQKIDVFHFSDENSSFHSHSNPWSQQCVDRNLNSPSLFSSNRFLIFGISSRKKVMHSK